MRKYLDHLDVVGEVIMTKTLFKGAILIVEGYIDKLLFEKFIEESKCIIVIGYKKNFIIQAMSVLKFSNKADGVITIIDSDYDRLDGKQYGNNFFLTDYHDIETMIINSNTLNDIMKELANIDKLTIFEKNQKKKIKEILLESASSIGYLLWFSLKNNLFLKIQNLDISKIINNKTLELKLSDVIKESIANSGSCPLTINDIENGVRVLQRGLYDKLQICRGHNLVEILFFGLKTIFGTNNTKSSISIKQFERILRLSYDSSYFISTELYKSIKEWERVNSSFQIFKNYN